MHTDLGFKDTIDFGGDSQDITSNEVAEQAGVMEFSDAQEDITDIPQPEDNFNLEEIEEGEEPVEEPQVESIEDIEEVEEEEVVEGEPTETDYDIDEEELKKTLLSSNILTEGDLEGAGSVEEAFQNKGSRIAREELEDFLQSSGEEAFEAFKAVIVHGVDPEEYFKKTYKVKRLSEMDITDETVQEKMVLEYYTKHVGLTDDEAQKRIEQKKDYNILESEAEIAKSFITRAEKDELEKEVQQKAYKKHLEQQEEEQKINSATSILEQAVKNNSLGGLPINNDDKEKALDYFTKKRFRNKSTGEELTGFSHLLLNLQYSQEPEFLEKALKIALLEKNNWDLSKYDKKVISRENKNTFSHVVRKRASNKAESNKRGDSFIVKK